MTHLDTVTLGSMSADEAAAACDSNPTTMFLWLHARLQRSISAYDGTSDPTFLIKSIRLVADTSQDIASRLLAQKTPVIVSALVKQLGENLTEFLEYLEQRPPDAQRVVLREIDYSEKTPP